MCPWQGKACLLAGFVMALSSSFAAEEKAFFTAPSRLANTERQMNTAGFWIGRHPAPDTVIMTPGGIAAFNDHTRANLHLTKDILADTGNFKIESLVSDFDKTIASFTDKGYYTTEGVRNDPAFMEKVRRNMNLPGVVLGMSPRYGLAVHYTDVRFLPTEMPLYESAGDLDFDQIQDSTLDVGTAVAVVHQSADKKWYYVLSSLSDGWVRAADVALGDEKTIRDFVQSQSFVVAVGPKADIFLDQGMTKHDDYVRMGTRLPLSWAADGKSVVLVPARGKDGKLQLVAGYMDSRDVHEGYLPYTPRVIYNQAFAMLNQPYGWGGMYGQQDCSAFLDEVFATVGIILPRNSKDQAQVGQALVEFDEKSDNEQKLKDLNNMPAPAVLLPMKGHIMLFLGMFDGRPYAIHAIWAYRERKEEKDVPRVINRVVVSDLSLGEGSAKGSLLKRLSKVVLVGQISL